MQDPIWAKAWFTGLEDAENFRKAMDQAIETGLATGDEQTAQTAETTARDFFLVRAVRAKG
jgi:hypothetical protein